MFHIHVYAFCVLFMIKCLKILNTLFYTFGLNIAFYAAVS